MSQYIRTMVTIEVPEGQSAEKIAQEMREAQLGTKVQTSLAHAIAPLAIEGADDLKVVKDEHFTHVCEFYDVDDCGQCRRAAAYSLRRTQAMIYG